MATDDFVVNMNSMATPLLIVEPPQVLRFTGPTTQVVSTNLAVRNPSDDRVAFKVKTTAPRRYAVRPNSGVLNAGESVNVSVMRQAFDLEPSERLKDKFMIQSVVLKDGQTLNTVWQDAQKQDLMDVRLRVQYDDHSSSTRSSVTDEEFQRMEGELGKLSKEMIELKEERRRLMDLAMNTAPEVQLPKGFSLIFREKKNILLIFIMLLLSFVAGVILSEQVLNIAATKS